jgi:hypothetical protein
MNTHDTQEVEQLEVVYVRIVCIISLLENSSERRMPESKEQVEAWTPPHVCQMSLVHARCVETKLMLSWFVRGKATLMKCEQTVRIVVGYRVT